MEAATHIAAFLFLVCFGFYFLVITRRLIVLCLSEIL